MEKLTSRCRRLASKAALALVPALLMSQVSLADYPTPTVTRPGILGKTFVISTSFNLRDYGYKEREYFYSGTANAYENTAPLTEDGKWSVRVTDQAEYKTRMVVYTPKDAADFNGTVLVEWFNVSGGVDTATEWMTMHTELLRQGYAYVGISAQLQGVEGGATKLPGPLPNGLPLKTVGPLRYHSLKHPGDSFSYDIYSQAAKAVRNPGRIDVLGGLKPKRVIAMGQSQSATRLLTYVNAFGVDNDLFDGYYIHSRLGNIADFGGASAPLADAPQNYISTPAVVKIRDDLGVPVMNLQSETDTYKLGAITSRQPDSDTLRQWEIAGAAHADWYIANLAMEDESDPESAVPVEEYTANAALAECPDYISSAPQHHFVAKAAMRAFNTWVAGGDAPRSFPRLETDASNQPVYDDFGNVLGGVRSPYVDAPRGIFSGDNSSVRNDTDICFLFGTNRLFTPEEMKTLWGSRSAYLITVLNATNAAVQEGTLLPEDAQLIFDDAANSPQF